VADPDAVAIAAQLDALMNERLRRAIETAAELEIAVPRHPRRPASGVVERVRRHRSQRVPLDVQTLKDPEATGRAPAPVADTVAPVGVLLVESTRLAIRRAGQNPVFR
jgi:hypothetical protein